MSDAQSTELSSRHPWMKVHECSIIPAATSFDRGSTGSSSGSVLEVHLKNIEEMFFE